MVEKLLLFLKSNNVATKSSTFLLAVSGGVDSVVLSYLLKESELNFSIAHCNFKLRDKESNQDQVYVENLARALSTKFYTTSFNTESIAKSRGVSIQMAARELRYDWFEELRTKHTYDYIITAHHKDDIAETVLFNLSKGTGIAGLHGIKPIVGHLLRPLLFATRQEILEIANRKNIKWREDSSNKSIKYSRNKIRHQILPLLEEINPKVSDSIYRTSLRISEAELFIDHALKSVLPTLVTKQQENLLIDLKVLETINGKGYVLYEVLKPFGFNYNQVQAILLSLGGLSGKLFYSLTHVVNADRKHLVLSPITNANERFELTESQTSLQLKNLDIGIKTVGNLKYTIASSNKVIAFDKDKLTFPLELRHWKQGDMFYPLGMKGQKKVSDFMIDAKIPVNLKSRLWLLVSKGEIAAILNHRLDDRFKITASTKNVYELTII